MWFLARKLFVALFGLLYEEFIIPITAQSHRSMQGSLAPSLFLPALFWPFLLDIFQQAPQTNANAPSVTDKGIVGTRIAGIGVQENLIPALLPI